jgi:hypothetical protein
MEASPLMVKQSTIRAKMIKKGDIITFKTPFTFKGGAYSQIGVMSIEKSKEKVRLIGFGKITKWFNSYLELDAAIDWEWMDEWIIKK